MSGGLGTAAYQDGWVAGLTSRSVRDCPAYPYGVNASRRAERFWVEGWAAGLDERAAREREAAPLIPVGAPEALGSDYG